LPNQENFEKKKPVGKKNRNVILEIFMGFFGEKNMSRVYDRPQSRAAKF